MPVRKSQAIWEGDLLKGRGTMSLGSGAWSGPYSFATRMQDQPGTNPEELIAAAHAGCFSMALSAALTKAGKPPRRIQTSAEVSLDKVGEGFKITRIMLRTRGEVPGLDETGFRKVADEAKRTCPVSQALAGADIALEASLDH
jgi:osmotically inducible protein OsmC